MSAAINYHRAGSGEPLLLIHGLGSRWQMWNPVLPMLAAQREVIAIDLPGFGESPMPVPGTRAGVASLTRLVTGFLDDLGLDRPHVAGNSLGGRLALELAKAGRARSATALSPAGFDNDREAVFQRLSLTASVRAVRLLAPAAPLLVATAAGRTLLLGQARQRLVDSMLA